MNDEQIKRGPGRPPKYNRARDDESPETLVNRARDEDDSVLQEYLRSLEGTDFVYSPETAGDRLHVPTYLIPAGMDFLWIAVSVYGQPNDDHVARFVRKGWRPVPADRDRRLVDHFGRKEVKGVKGAVIEVEGLRLYERPLEYTKKARDYERAQAIAQRQIKESQLGAGDLPGVTLDTKHPSALKQNRFSTSVERLMVPEE